AALAGRSRNCRARARHLDQLDYRGLRCRGTRQSRNHAPEVRRAGLETIAPERDPSTSGSRAIPRPAVVALGLYYYRDDHGAAAVLRVHPAADRATDDLAERVRVAGAVLGGLRQRLHDQGLDCIENGIVLGETARLDLG